MGMSRMRRSVRSVGMASPKLPAILIAALIGVATLLAASPRASAQLPSASVRSLGLSGSDTAMARGVGAISANPAGLAMPDSGFSLAIIPVGVSADFGEIRVEQLRDAAGAITGSGSSRAEGFKDLSETLLDRGARVRVRTDLTAFALTLGDVVEQVSIGLQAGAAASFGADIAAVNAENPVDLDADGYLVTTVGLGAARPLPILTEHLDTVAVGATVKYSLGHLVAIADGSARRAASNSTDGLGIDELSVDAVYGVEVSQVIGSGIGVDAGVMATRDRWSFGVSVQNLPATFTWDRSKLTYLAELSGDLDERPFEEAPADLKSKLPQPLVPSARIGAAYRAVDELTISGDFHYRFGDTLAAWPTLHAGVGAEYRPVDVVELRAGAALISDAVQFSGGASLILGPCGKSLRQVFVRHDPVRIVAH